MATTCMLFWYSFWSPCDRIASVENFQPFSSMSSPSRCFVWRDPVEWQFTVFNVPISTVDNTITSHHLKVPEVKEFRNKLSFVSLAYSLVLWHVVVRTFLPTSMCAHRFSIQQKCKHSNSSISFNSLRQLKLWSVITM